MTKVSENITIPQSRLETLLNRYERLIESNYTKGYVRSEKAGRYLNLIKNLKKQIFECEQQNREKNKDSKVSRFLKASSGLNGFQILRATN